MIDVDITFNKKLLKKIITKLNQLDDNMATIEENTAIIAEIAETVRGNTSLIESVRTSTAKIFDEVEKLVASANADIPGLAELRAATLAQTDLLVGAAAASTEVDNLIPDLPA